MKLKLIITVMFLAIFAMAQPYIIPTGTNASSAWWETSPGTNRVTNWEAWQTMNTNWAWMSYRFPTNNALKLPAYTIANATDTTWDMGAGLVVCDTNYIYISVATNVWKRCALTNW